MSLLNIISVPTAYGIKTIEIHNDDITKLSFDIDVLVISSYHNKYYPAPNTVINALMENTGLIIDNLAKKPMLDMRSSLNCWISEEIKNLAFKHILCVEGIKTDIKTSGTSEDSLGNLFGVISLFQYKKIKASSIAMPLLGAGFQDNSIEIILPNLIENAVSSLSSNPALNTIYFVEIDKEKAKIIDETINKYLKRGSDKLELVLEDPLLLSILELILMKLVQIRNNYKFYHNKTIKNLITKIKNKNLRFFELGILCRKLLELLLKDISDLESDKYISIYEYINDLKSKNVADWMITYLHTLRIFGNFVAHEGESHEIPDHMEKTDVIVFSHALNRFLDLYISFKNDFIQLEK